MNIKMILIDFDGTLLMPDQVNISDYTMATLRAAMDKGIYVVPCTGRVADMFPKVLLEDPKVRYGVSCHGARVFDKVKNRIIWEDVMSAQASYEICKLFEGKQIYGEIAANGTIYMEQEVIDHIEQYSVPPHHVWYIEEKRYTAVPSLSEFFRSSGIGIEKVNLYGIPESLQKSLYDAFEATGHIKFTRTGYSKDIEFQPIHLDKMKAIGVLCEKLGIGMENVMAFGDSPSDAPVLHKAKLGVAMGNAPDSVKKMADLVTLDYTDDGVAAVIEKYLLAKPIMK